MPDTLKAMLRQETKKVAGSAEIRHDTLVDQTAPSAKMIPTVGGRNVCSGLVRLICRCRAPWRCPLCRCFDIARGRSPSASVPMNSPRRVALCAPPLARTRLGRAGGGDEHRQNDARYAYFIANAWAMGRHRPCITRFGPILCRQCGTAGPRYV